MFRRLIRRARLRRASGAVSLALLLLVVGTGCQGVTSSLRRVADRLLEDRVRDRLTEVGVGRDTIRVDTYGGTVYLTGEVASEAAKRRAEDTARRVKGVDLVVSQVQVIDGTTPAVVSGIPAPAARRHRLFGWLTKLDRVDLETGTPAWTQYAAYDGGGRRVATVYEVPVNEFRLHGTAELNAGGREVDHISIYRDAISPNAGVDGVQYLVVLWHVNRQEAARLQ